MKCVIGCGSKASPIVQQVLQSDKSNPLAIAEPSGILLPAAITTAGATSAKLYRGSYKIQGVVSNPGGAAHFIENREYIIPYQGENKRVFFHKIDVQPGQTIDGKTGSNFTAVVTVLDNPLPIAAIVYGLSAIGTLTAGWFFVDRLDRFTQSGIGGILTIAAAGIGIYTFLK